MNVRAPKVSVPKPVQRLRRAVADRRANGGPIVVDPGVAISVQGVSKRFAIPADEPETLVGRLRRPLRHFHRDSLLALEEISFEVQRGEFFGIVGANGSGKTTMLQLLANVYKADKGRILIAPRVAPIISLGIGFQQDLTALPNVLQTAQLLGVSAADARKRFDDVIEFAELEEFTNLKLRNYSSGMRVRLAFGIVMLVDADVLLFDEVFAVGDAGFKDKAAKAFESLRRDKTVVLVTHNMSHLQTFCNRAVLLNKGRMEVLGEVGEVARRYAELALEDHGQSGDLPAGVIEPAQVEPRAEIADLWLADEDGERITSVAPGGEITLHATVKSTAAIKDPGFRFEIRRRGAARIFAPPTLSLRRKRAGGRGPQGVRAGGRLQVETTIENKLAPGPYTIVCAVIAKREAGERTVSAARTIDFVVAAGEAESAGIVNLEHRVRVRGRRRGGSKQRDAGER